MPNDSTSTSTHIPKFIRIIVMFEHTIKEQHNLKLIFMYNLISIPLTIPPTIYSNPRSGSLLPSFQSM